MTTRHPYWYCYVPLHVAGSGNTLIGKVCAPEPDVRAAWEKCATIDAQTKTVRFFKRAS